ncbi:hypothetical protein [Nocardioides ganghwensis]|nr:hypothetical protein [Nocardioides ganghwensis]MBD3944473.1 hypothetical protein [Nocardioides ganghwensis]
MWSPRSSLLGRAEASPSRIWVAQFDLGVREAGGRTLDKLVVVAGQLPR